MGFNSGLKELKNTKKISIEDFVKQYILEKGLVLILRLKTEFNIYSLGPDSS
jgi:hypothetical protein